MLRLRTGAAIPACSHAELPNSLAKTIRDVAASGAAAIQMWWHSPGHHKNLLGGRKRTGLGRFERHWTQLFG